MKRLIIPVIRFCVHAALYPLELILRAQGGKDAPPPIFIIGAPRSGTSLLYELMITRFRFAYISNLAHRFYLTPLAASWIGKSRIAAWRGNFTSRFGHIAGWGAPNEGGWVWRRWLDDGDWRDETGFPDEDAVALRTLTRGLSRIFGAPFLNKNVMHSNRLRLMHEIWPEALYIQVRRDVADNVRSIVRAERKEGGPAHDADRWWSVRPSIAPDFIGKDDIARAVAQVIGTDHDIGRDIETIGPARLLTIDYADICEDPRGALAAIERFAESSGARLADNGEIPEKFSPPPSKPLSDAEELQIVSVRRKIEHPGM